jgi:hypothetical protein
MAESLFATIKRELIDARSWPKRAELRHGVFQYIEGWYNTRRLHSTLGYLSRAQCEAVLHSADSVGTFNTTNPFVEPNGDRDPWRVRSRDRCGRHLGAQPRDRYGRRGVMMPDS